MGASSTDVSLLVLKALAILVLTIDAIILGGMVVNLVRELG